MKLFNILFTLLLINSFVIANGQDKKDTNSIMHAFKKGKVEGHFRVFYMNTNNAEPVTEYK